MSLFYRYLEFVEDISLISQKIQNDTLKIRYKGDGTMTRACDIPS